MNIHRLAPALLLLPLCLSLAACAALDEASVGRTDRLTDATFYVSYKQPANDGPVVVVPVTLDPESGEPFNLAGPCPRLAARPPTSACSMARRLRPAPVSSGVCMKNIRR